MKIAIIFLFLPLSLFAVEDVTDKMGDTSWGGGYWLAQGFCVPYEHVIAFQKAQQEEERKAKERDKEKDKENNEEKDKKSDYIKNKDDKSIQNVDSKK